MDVNDNALILDKYVVLKHFASRLAPQVLSGFFEIEAGRAPLDAALFCARDHAKQQ
jgi:hypothetical protein